MKTAALGLNTKRVKCMSKKLENPYIPARLVDYEGDLSKDWYLIYWVWDTDKQELVRRRPWGEINRYITAVERYKEAFDFIKEIDDLLKNGATAGSTGDIEDESELDQIRGFTVVEAIDFVLQKKKSSLRDGTFKDYSSLMFNMEIFLKKRGQSFLKMSAITNLFLKSFCQFIKDERNLANKTHNNLISTVATVMTYLKKFIPDLFKPGVDPAFAVDRLECETSKHRAYSMEQMVLIKEEILIRKDKQLLMFIQFIFFTLARPKELKLMRIAHILKDKIFIPSFTSKNKHGDYVNIPPPLESLIVEFKLRSYPKDYYVFSQLQKPAAIPVGINYFYKRYKKVLEHFDLHGTDLGYDVYSFKHTGAINMYLCGVELAKISEQCRHETIEQTMDYLRELDVFRKNESYVNVTGF